jgi:hypothetical protein
LPLDLKRFYKPQNIGFDLLNTEGRGGGVGGERRQRGR